MAASSKKADIAVGPLEVRYEMATLYAYMLQLFVAAFPNVSSAKVKLRRVKNLDNQKS